jgi:hypothetical protein
MASRKSNKIPIIASLLIVSLLGGAVTSAYVLTTPAAQHVPPDLRRADKAQAKAPTNSQANEKRIVPRTGSEGTTFATADIKFPPGVDHRVYLVNDYLGQLHGKGLGKPDAKALGVDVRDGTAYLDLNSAFDETYGTQDEGTVLNGILTVLGQYPEIDQVQFEINGKPMETTGNVDLTVPQPVIRPGRTVPVVVPTSNSQP